MNFQPLCYRSDVVFEGRNKAYGAYIMRKLYEKRILTSALLAILAFAIAMIGPVLYNNLSAGEKEETKEVRIKMTKLPEPPKVEPPPPPVLPPPPPPPPQVETIRFLPPEPEIDEKVNEVPPKQEEATKTQTAAVKQEGNTDENLPRETEVVKEIPPVVEVPQQEQIYTVVQQQAEFPGGAKGMQKFMDRNYKQPKAVQRLGITGKVFVKFVVRKTGAIEEVQVSRGIANCPECDAEALRLVKAMPPFKPAQQNGNAVSVWFTLPISFKMND